MNEIFNNFIDLVAERLRSSILDLNNCTKQVLDDELFTIEQVCEKLHISRATFYRHRNMGLIVPTKFAGRRPLLTQEDIDKYLNMGNGQL